MRARARSAVPLALAVCASMVFVSNASAQSSVKPYMQVVVDTSGSMYGSMANSCGQAGTKLNAAKCVLQDLVNAYGDVQFGLSSFRMVCGLKTNGDDVYTVGCVGKDVRPDTGRTLVPLREDNQLDLLKWIDFDPLPVDTGANFCPLNDDPEEILTNSDGYGRTPIAGSLYSAQRYYQGFDPDFPFDWPIDDDPKFGCRPYFVIMLTDGNETCADGSSQSEPPGDPAVNRQAAVDAATALRTTATTRGTVDIRTYVIAFGLTATADNDADHIAVAGGTDISGKAYYAQDEQGLALAFAQIVADSTLVEVCNGIDDDCDGETDEGFVLYCDKTTGHTDQDLCVNPGDPCDGVDDNCVEGIADEVRNRCGQCGPEPTEVCNGFDDDCDNFIDEGNVCGGCSPEAEICDGQDNDCDGRFDEDVTRPCGSDVGECVGGTQTCVEQGSAQPMGTWGACTGGVGPTTEDCDGLDNDCDGLADQFVRECYTFASGCDAMFNCEGICKSGFETCTASAWGACVGQIGPVPEVCNGIDDDCDGFVDNGTLPGVGETCSSGCGTGMTECVGGRIVCVGGGTAEPEECNGFDDDCDGLIDETNNPPPDGLGSPLGDSCDEGGTLCSPGNIECVNGGWQCVGGIAPELEQCDCKDNDCDGATDEEDPDPICPPGATCIQAPHCVCARPCGEGEFPCPLGQVCVDPANDGNRFCVPDLCVGVTCDPLGQMGNATVCVDGACTPICDTVTCGGGLVCRESDGVCVPDDCRGFPDRCQGNELCLGGDCVADPCFGVDCPGNGQFCSGGTCIDSCAGVECPAGQSCQSGACAADPCAEVECNSLTVCNPDTGECVPEQCSNVSCPGGQVCDPPTGDCVPDACLGVVCPAGQLCVRGDCFAPGDLDPSDPDPVDHTYVSPGGGGGCAAGGSSGGAMGLIMLTLCGIVAARRKRVALLR